MQAEERGRGTRIKDRQRRGEEKRDEDKGQAEERRGR